MTNFFSILKPTADTTASEIKKNYRQLVKENHPDLFPPEERHKQNLILMEINAAYLGVLTRKSDFTTTTHVKPPTPVRQQEGLVLHKDPAYALSKNAHRLYREGQEIFNSRYSLKNMKLSHNENPESILEAALKAIELFAEAGRYYNRLITEHPDSIWYHDAVEKLEYLAKMNERYSVIVELVTGEG